MGTSVWAKPKIAILGLEAKGAMDPQVTDVAKTLTDALRNRAGSSGQYSPSTNKRELVDEKLMGNCASEALQCMGAIANNLGAEYVLYGHIERTKDGYQIDLKLLKVNTKPVSASPQGAPHDQFYPSGEVTGASVSKWADAVWIKLTGEKVEKPNGKLVVKVSNSLNGKVMIDGDDKGELDGGKLSISLPEGAYKLVIDADGFERFEALAVEVKSGVTNTEEYQLIRRDEPPPPPTKSRTKLILGIAGGASLTASAIIGFGVWYQAAKGPIADYQALLNREGEAAVDVNGNELDSESCDKQSAAQPEPAAGVVAFKKACDANAKTKWAIPVTVTTGLLGVGLLAYAILTKSPEAPTQTSLRVRKREIALTPIVTPTVSGAVLRIDW